MQRIFISSLVVLSFSWPLTYTSNAQCRIANGTVTTIDKVPYLVQLRHFGKRLICGGSLIAPQYVVTAAHCFNEYFYRHVTVVGGVSTLTEQGIACNIESIDLHPMYNSADMHTDVAIAKLSKPMAGKHIATVPLCNRPLVAGDFIQISGWGRTSPESQLSNELQTARISVLSEETCKREYEKFVEKNMFCGSGDKGISFYKGDSGGPVIHKGQLCGINSFTYGCGNTSVFTDVYALREYIEEALQDLHVLEWDSLMKRSMEYLKY